MHRYRYLFVCLFKTLNCCKLHYILPYRYRYLFVCLFKTVNCCKLYYILPYRYRTYNHFWSPRRLISLYFLFILVGLAGRPGWQCWPTVRQVSDRSRSDRQHGYHDCRTVICGQPWDYSHAVCRHKCGSSDVHQMSKILLRLWKVLQTEPAYSNPFLSWVWGCVGLMCVSVCLRYFNHSRFCQLPTVLK